MIPPSTQISFGTWVETSLHSIETQQLIIYLIIGFIGIFLHYLKLWVTQNVEGSFYKYLIGDHPRQTLVTMLSFVGSSIGYIYSGAMVGSGWPALIGLAFTTGYSLDSAFNKGNSSKITETSTPVNK